jgi:hypothetical protein
MKKKPAFLLTLPFLFFCTTLLAQTPTITNISPAQDIARSSVFLNPSINGCQLPVV